MKAIPCRTSADALIVRVECRQEVILITGAAPAPVDVEVVHVVYVFVAVADKLMTAARRLSAIDDGAGVLQLVIEHVSPFGCAIVAARHTFCGGLVVIKVVLQGFSHAGG